MSKNTKWVLGLVAIVVLIVGVVYFTKDDDGDGLGAITSRTIESMLPGVQQVRKLQTNFPIETSSTTKTGGAGDLVARFNHGICYFAPDATTIAASSSQTVTCQATRVHGAGIAALTGVAFGDFVQVMMSSTTSAGGVDAVVAVDPAGLVLLGATASSSQGFIELNIYNSTGATYTWPLDTNASGTASYISGN